MAKKSNSNDMRCAAAEIICRLYENGDVSQLELLKIQLDLSLELLAPKSESAPSAPAPERELAAGQFKANWALREHHGFRDARYAPADGSPLLLIEAGSSGIHDGWRDEDGFWIFDGETYPSNPCLFKPRPGSSRLKSSPAD
jgi:hypothetical protein